MTPEDITGARTTLKEPTLPELLTLRQELDEVIAKCDEFDARLTALKDDPHAKREDVDALDRELKEFQRKRTAVEKKYSAYNMEKSQYRPTSVENFVHKIMSVPNPAQKELYVGGGPPGPNAVVEAIFDRQRIIQTAVNMSSPRAPEEKVARFVNSILNNGFALEKIQQLSVMDATQDLVAACDDIFTDCGITTPGVEDVEALAACCRALVQHIMTHHGGGVKTGFRNFEVKTPFIAWQIKEQIVKALLTSDTKITNADGPDNKRQVEEFIANFSTTDIVLWNSDIWKAAVRGYESFVDTPLTKDIIGAVTPMFWQHDLPIALGKNHWKTFNIEDGSYEVGGICILPTVEQFVTVEVGEDAITNKEELDHVKDGETAMIVIDFEHPEGQKAIQDARDRIDRGDIKLGRQGLSVGIAFLPVNDSTRPPEFRFMNPIYEGDIIKGRILPVFCAAIKFLTLKYVAKSDASVAKRELKKDRELFKKVRRGKVQVPPIKIVNLRRPERRVRTEKENQEAKQYACHWLVESHWRQQYFPTLQRRMPVRILSYVKGNLDKPFKPPRERVFKAVR